MADNAFERLVPRQRNALMDAAQGVSKGFWADGLGGPVDLMTTLANLGIAGGGYAGHKLGLLSQPPELIQNPTGGSEWIAQKMRSAGLLNDNPGSTADNYGRVAGGLLAPLTQARAPQIANALNQAPAALQRGAYAVGEKGADMASNHLQRIGAQPSIFAGTGAKTADRAALSQAEKLTAAGADPRKIWKDTGWMKGGDGKWRFEIDDSAAKARDYQLTPKEAYQQARQEAAWSGGDPARAASMNDYAGMPVSALRAEFKRTGGEISAAAIAGDKPKAMQLLDDRRGLDALLTEMGNRQAGPMSAYLKHGELGQAYPDVYKLHTRIDPTLDAQGQYLRGSAHQGEQMVLKEKPTWTDARSTALHEMQHAVQQREGFARGGSPESFAAQFDAENARLPVVKAQVDQMKGAAFEQSRDALASNSAIVAEAKNFALKMGEFSSSQPIEAQISDYLLSKNDGYKRAYKELSELQQSSRLALHDRYKRLAGEAEARAVQSRMKLNQQERRDLFPLDSYDVPINGLLYR